MLYILAVDIRYQFERQKRVKIPIRRRFWRMLRTVASAIIKISLQLLEICS
jgi:hypothetical protein